ncbi:hypothetical protein FRC19_005852 [Serendipita sp. 401]|nr:hypothetical protein FRC19_005852 [Serendipita sp. 401]
MPLADLSEAFNTSSTLAASTSHNAASSKQDHPVESTVHELDVDDLTATLRLLLASADDYVCLPAVLQTRGIKRTLDSNKPSGTSRASRRSSTGGSDCINPRPAKRIRKNSVPPPPPNSPLAFRALSLPLTSENVELLQTKDEEVEDYNTQDETQGSSHFSSVLGSLSDRAGVSFESLLLQETSFGSQLL